MYVKESYNWYLGVITVVFRTNTVLLGAQIVIFVANSVVFGSDSVVFGEMWSYLRKNKLYLRLIQ